MLRYLANSRRLTTTSTDASRRLRTALFPRRNNSTSTSSSPGNSGSKKADDDISLAKHAGKTLITYLIPLAVFGAFSLYTQKKEKDNELTAASSGKESFGSILARVFKGEKVWETMGPRKEYIKVTRLNDKYDNYNYCLEKSSISGGISGGGRGSGGGGALAELNIRHKEAIGKLRSKGFVSSVRPTELTDAKLKTLLDAEKEYNKAMEKNLEQQDAAMRQFRSLIMKIAPPRGAAGDAAMPKAAGATASTFSAKEVAPIPTSAENIATADRLMTTVGKLVTQQVAIEQQYVAAVAGLLSDDERKFLAEYLSSMDAPGATGQFQLYKEAPLAAALLLGVNVDNSSSSEGETKSDTGGSSLKAPLARTAAALGAPRVFVLEFNGDVMASQVRGLREEVTAILQQADVSRGDSVVIKLNSGGGTVTGYGLAASQLIRLKQEAPVSATAGEQQQQQRLPVVVCVDEVAASGGYMMACVADQIYVSPFAAIGSIGVIASVPNFYERLKREGVQFIDVTAGQYKRTLTPYKEPTPEDRAKMQQEVGIILDNFKKFITQQRPQLKDKMEGLATGEVWLGAEAVEKGLVDGVRCFDDVVLEKIQRQGAEVLQLKYVGDKIEAKEEEDGFWVSGASESRTAGVADRAVAWLSDRVLHHIMHTVFGEVAQRGNSGGIASGSGIPAVPLQGNTTWQHPQQHYNSNTMMAYDPKYAAGGAAGTASGTPMMRYDGALHAESSRRGAL